jgi:hypothetical protein
VFRLDTLLDVTRAAWCNTCSINIRHLTWSPSFGLNRNTGKSAQTANNATITCRTLTRGARTYTLDSSTANGGRRTLSEREIWEEAAESIYQADCRVIFALCSFDLLSNHVNRVPGSRIELSIALPPLNPGFQIEGSAIDDYDSGVSLEYRFVMKTSSAIANAVYSHLCGLHATMH